MAWDPMLLSLESSIRIVVTYTGDVAIGKFPSTLRDVMPSKGAAGLGEGLWTWN